GMHWSWWRGQVVRSPAAGWTLVWALALAAVLLVNGVLGVVPQDAQEPLLLARFLLHASAVALSLPAVHAYARGPSPRALVAGLAVWYAAATALVVTTDLVVVHGAGTA